MEVREDFAERQIAFVLMRDDPEALQKLSFVHLIKMKFYGDEVECSSAENEGNDPYIKVILAFEDWSVTSNAKEHCDQHLDESGSVISTYVGALPYADPGHAIARKILRRALANQVDS